MSIQFEPQSVLFFGDARGQRTLEVRNGSDTLRYAISVAFSDESVYTCDPETTFLEPEGNITLTVDKKSSPMRESLLKVTYVQCSDTDINPSRVMQRRGIQKTIHTIKLKKTESIHDPTVGNADGMTFARDTLATHEKKKNKIARKGKMEKNQGILNTAKKRVLDTGVPKKKKSDAKTSQPAQKPSGSQVEVKKSSETDVDQESTAPPMKKKKSDPHMNSDATCKELVTTTKRGEPTTGDEPFAGMKVSAFVGLCIEKDGQRFQIGGSIGHVFPATTGRKGASGSFTKCNDPNKIKCSFCGAEITKTNRSKHYKSCQLSYLSNGVNCKQMEHGQSASTSLPVIQEASESESEPGSEKSDDEYDE